MPSDRRNHRQVNSLEILLGSLQFYEHHYFPLRREGRLFRLEPVVLPRAFLLHADHGCQPAPGLPCALCFDEGGFD